MIAAASPGATDWRSIASQHTQLHEPFSGGLSSHECFEQSSVEPSRSKPGDKKQSGRRSNGDVQCDSQ